MEAKEQERRRKWMLRRMRRKRRRGRKNVINLSQNYKYDLDDLKVLSMFLLIHIITAF